MSKITQIRQSEVAQFQPLGGKLLENELGCREPSIPLEEWERVEAAVAGLSMAKHRLEVVSFSHLLNQWKLYPSSS